ncbi:uncharacterized protein L3040_002414 [Drepanopeziza brunnea f. sp. 'multigermtubi']|uniref:uncharacterized protein n=1 Tax=Drepanopeziza brunnea f. sp. 'multigermtubi' TaxID=698441 RepID=UPI00239F1308|nr:hypothetical protein L3040_002414 [Drepanopeziza brunnea f. sp. 'multigermtubi']
MQYASALLDRPQEHPIRSLATLYLLWKSLLLLVAACSPGPGYDTSASLTQQPLSYDRELPLALRYILTKLTRWDALYFVKISTRGYLFEQEWAFGWGFTRIISAFTAVSKAIGVPDYVGLEGLVAVCIAHASHLLSVLAVLALTRAIFPYSSSEFAFKAALLHIISPAGLFLSAPYAESSCAFLSIVGCFLFTKGVVHPGPATSSHDLSILISGICFGIATTFRSNGILNGLLLLEEAFRTVYRLRDGPSLATVRRLMATGLGGMSVGAGFVVPQYIAYIEYCKGQQSVARIWCEGTLPSIYTFVQDHYWNCGFFRYWTLSNAPLFLLAAPILVILIASSLWALSVEPQTPGQPPAPGAKGVDINTGARQVLRNLAVSQLVLVLLTTTAAHVQIITRISSAYPVWLWYGSASSMVGGNLLGENFVKFMIIYAMIQGGLFASFLPPA